MNLKLSDFQVKQALAAVDSPDVSTQEKMEMLMEIAMGLQQRPETAEQLLDAVSLYNRALELCPDNDSLTRARLRARRATALQLIPEQGFNYLLSAKEDMELALVVLESDGSAEEAAEGYLNLGLIFQALANFGKARITDAIMHYQKSLRVFTKDKHPAEFAILNNNLATAYLSIPLYDERAKLKEALAVQSFQAALEVVTLEDDPNEYAMLQNNLGNALQYVSSSHVVENNLRALDAYDEALKVRNRRVSPISYANTISNKANCLRNLPDDLENPQLGNPKRLEEAHKYYSEAAEIFREFGEIDKAQTVQEAIQEIAAELSSNGEQRSS